MNEGNILKHQYYQYNKTLKMDDRDYNAMNKELQEEQNPNSRLTMEQLNSKKKYFENEIISNQKALAKVITEIISRA